MIETLVPLLAPLSVWSALGDFFNTIMTPLYWAVSGLLVLFHTLWAPVLGADSGWTWALSIICLTIVIRIILIPLFVRQIHSSRKMQLLQPKIQALRKKYGHDQQRLGQETMKLYREENANPMASCLPLLLQSPVFIALYRVLDGASRINPETGRPTAHGYWLEKSPQLLDSLNQSTVFAARLAEKFWPINDFSSVQVVAAVMIILMTATMFYTQLQLTRKNMPKDALEGPMAQQQKTMLYLFPLIFVVMGVNIPIGVLFYWLTSQLWTMGQQYYVIKRNPAPGTEAYEIWEAKQKAKGHDPADPLTVPNSRRPAPSAAGAQSTTNGSSADGASGNGSTPGGQPARPQRQQPKRQTRSQRKS
ncbi:membrane protein insertase YidC [Microlunatus soli]|uniref:Membrane protein insertase YidC n=1 Tax=Microlunatus soli TaxID=630515 RepID=A0A1H1UK07_9ACTN|nr:membrane protein insertase YidC [Microlunatus soli]SDS72818.1 YidC/Oxa1 family membrane protein insertase [Microlunatus soli]